MDDALLEHLLHDIKDKIDYPPPSLIQGFVKDPSRPRGMTREQCPEGTALYCVAKIKMVLLDFTEKALSNTAALDLKSEIEIQSAVNNATQEMFIEARGLLANEFSGQWEWGRSEALTVLDQGQAEIRNQLHRRIKLRNLNLGAAPMPSVHVSGSHNVSVVIGSLNTSIQQIIDKGGAEEQAGRILQEFIEVVSKLEKRYEAQQGELLRLTKGLVKELGLSQEERNPSTIHAILDRVQKVGLAITGATELIHFLTEKLPELLRLFGLSP